MKSTFLSFPFVLSTVALVGCGATAPASPQLGASAQGGSPSGCVSSDPTCPGAPDAGASDSAPVEASSTTSQGAPAGGAAILASAQSAQSLAFDSSYLYWTTADGLIVRASKTTGHLVAVSGGGTAIAVQGSTLFAVSGGGAGSVEELDLTAAFGTRKNDVIGGLQGPTSIVADDTYFYVTETGSQSVQSCEEDSHGSDACIGKALVSTGLLQPDAIVQDSSSVYWINHGASSIMRAAKSGGGATVVVPASAAAGSIPQALAIAGSRLFWSSVSFIMAADVDGTNPTVLFDGGSAALYAGGIATDGTRVYWIDAAGVRSVPVGGGAAEVVWTGTTDNESALIAVDDTQVYWTDAAFNVWSRAK